jgi:ribosome biogenesis GTPase
VGDAVLFQPDEINAGGESGAGEGTGVIEKLLPRRSYLSRPPVANIEQIVLVMALKDPSPDWQLAGRILLQAGREGLKVLCCLNKVDLVDKAEKNSVSAMLEPFPYPLLFTSAERGVGIAHLRETLQGRTTVFAGPSGAGKSSLLNAVQPDLALKTGKVSDKIGRGRHITRHAELLPLRPAGFVVDTPGFSRLSLAGLKSDQLAGLFPEFASHLGRCTFRDCSHIHEPGCAVRDAVTAGEISDCRYRQYRFFWKELIAEER